MDDEDVQPLAFLRTLAEGGGPGDSEDEDEDEDGLGAEGGGDSDTRALGPELSYSCTWYADESLPRLS